MLVKQDVAVGRDRKHIYIIMIAPGQGRDPTTNKRVLFIDTAVVENGRAVRLLE
jgi:hypothetical protein